MELRDVCDVWTRETVKEWFSDWEISDYLPADKTAVVNNSGIFDKNKLLDMIIDHYWLREIGFETVGEFKWQAGILMKEIMEEKSRLIYSVCVDIDPLVNEDYTETFERSANRSDDGSSSANSTTTSNGSGLGITSDTPQGQITKDEILQGKYASGTQAEETENSGTSESSGTSKNQTDESETYTRKLKGNRGIDSTQQRLIQQYRDIIIGVYRDIIESVNELFMGIY